MRVRMIHGDALANMLDRTKPQITYWPTFRALEYDSAEQLLPAGLEAGQGDQESAESQRNG